MLTDTPAQSLPPAVVENDSGKAPVTIIPTIRVRTNTGTAIAVPATLHASKLRVRSSVLLTLEIIEQSERRMLMKMKKDPDYRPASVAIKNLSSAKDLMLGTLSASYANEELPVLPPGMLPSPFATGVAAVVHRKVIHPDGQITKTEEESFRQTIEHVANLGPKTHQFRNRPDTRMPKEATEVDYIAPEREAETEIEDKEQP